MDTMGITSFGAITAICYLVAEAIKQTEINNKWLPVICGSMGGVLGALSMVCVPDFPATDYINSIAIGIVSGFAATGVNQVFKQLRPTDKHDKKQCSRYR